MLAFLGPQRKKTKHFRERPITFPGRPFVFQVVYQLSNNSLPLRRMPRNKNKNPIGKPEFLPLFHKTGIKSFHLRSFTVDPYVPEEVLAHSRIIAVDGIKQLTTSETVLTEKSAGNDPSYVSLNKSKQMATEATYYAILQWSLTYSLAYS